MFRRENVRVNACLVDSCAITLQRKWFLDGIFDGSGTELDFRNFTHGQPLTISPKLMMSDPSRSLIRRFTAARRS